MTTRSTILAPYFYLWACNNNAYKIKSLCDARKKFGLTTATLAFVLAGSSGVTGGAGLVNAELAQSVADIVAFHQMGGSTIVSFGGASGPYLEERIKDPNKLFSVWDEIIIATGTSSFDFDIEGAYIENKAMNTVRTDALRLLQKKYPKMYISFTLAVMPPDAYGNESLGAPQMTLIKAMIAAGIKLSLVNLMTMDFYQTSPITMGQRSIDCAESVHRQLSVLYPGTPSNTIYSMIGITPMIGKNDDPTVFDEADARLVSQYARSKGIGLIAYWALQRDQQGTGELAIYSQANSADFSFYRAFASALPNSPVTTTNVPPPTPAPSPASKPVPKPAPLPPNQTVLPWSDKSKYAKGNKVSYKGTLYTCITPHTAQVDWIPSATPALWQAAV